MAIADSLYPASKKCCSNGEKAINNGPLLPVRLLCRRPNNGKGQISAGKKQKSANIGSKIEKKTGRGATMGRMTMKSMHRVLGHSLFRLLIFLTHSLAPHCSLCSLAMLARFACTIRFANSFVFLLTSSLQSSWEKDFCLRFECVDFMQFQPTVRWSSTARQLANVLQSALKRRMMDTSKLVGCGRSRGGNRDL